MLGNAVALRPCLPTAPRLATLWLAGASLAVSAQTPVPVTRALPHPDVDAAPGPGHARTTTTGGMPDSTGRQRSGTTGPQSGWQQPSDIPTGTGCRFLISVPAQDRLPHQRTWGRTGAGREEGTVPMVTAFVLINVDNKQFKDMADRMLEIPGVKEVHVVAGEYDMVAVARVADTRALSELITGRLIHTPGVHRTKTLIALDSFSRLDLKALFDL